MTWTIQLTNEDGSIYRDKSEPFETELDLFDILRKEFSDISFVRSFSKRSILYRLVDPSIVGSVYAVISEEPNASS